MHVQLCLAFKTKLRVPIIQQAGYLKCFKVKFNEFFIPRSLISQCMHMKRSDNFPYMLADQILYGTQITGISVLRPPSPHPKYQLIRYCQSALKSQIPTLKATIDT